MDRPPPDPFPLAEPGLDALIRAALDQEAARADGAAVWDRVLTRLNADVPAPVTPPRPRRWRYAGAVLIALAASVAVVVLAGWGTPSAAASPAAVVQAARVAHTAADERCYRIVASLPEEARGRFPLLADSERSTHVWTRGNRFVVEPGFGGRGAWGREADEQVWIAPHRTAAARFRLDELPPSVREAVLVRGLELPNLLSTLLADCDLAWTGPPTAPRSTLTATARERAGPHPLVSAELTLDHDQPTIRTLVLTRQMHNGGHFRLTFTREAAAPRPDADYTAAGHVNVGAPVYDSERPLQRRRVLLQGLGSLLAPGG